jgi:hypothetical protein
MLRARRRLKAFAEDPEFHEGVEQDLHEEFENKVSELIDKELESLEGEEED